MQDGKVYVQMDQVSNAEDIYFSLIGFSMAGYNGTQNYRLKITGSSVIKQCSVRNLNRIQKTVEINTSDIISLYP